MCPLEENDSFLLSSLCGFLCVHHYDVNQGRALVVAVKSSNLLKSSIQNTSLPLFRFHTFPEVTLYAPHHTTRPFPQQAQNFLFPPTSLHSSLFFSTVASTLFNSTLMFAIKPNHSTLLGI